VGSQPEDDPHTSLRVAHPCSLCDQPAATVTLAADGLLVVEAQSAARPNRLPPPTSLARAQSLLAGMRALYTLNAEWASFYCPTCNQSYCRAHWRRAHWRFEAHYDTDFPEWYDYLCGRPSAPG
jgi:hypothetical protein